MCKLRTRPLSTLVFQEQFGRLIFLPIKRYLIALKLKEPYVVWVFFFFSDIFKA